MKYSGTFGNLLLAIGLIVWGLSLLIGFALPSLLVALWGILTGLLLLVGR